MINESKIKRALEKIKRKDKKDEFKEQGLDLEKNDLLAMIIAGIVVILPAVLVVFAIIFAVVWFFYFR
jgi:hypothetical protein